MFLVFSLLCTLVFVWQYRLRHGSLCCKNAEEGGRAGARGAGDWWSNTMGVGKQQLSFKRGLTDSELLRAVASDSYD